MLELTILCKVVDNFGDIGVAYRLARSILDREPDAKLRLVVSCLESFSRICPAVNPLLHEQVVEGMNVFDWNDHDLCKNEFSLRPPRIILECFQCGRPDWLEEILFDDSFTDTVQIINIEYLTAESWADGFHLLKSGTRKASIKKVNFMPGFTERTAGLIQDEKFMQCLCRKNQGASGPSVPHVLHGSKNESSYRVLVFSYPKDFAFLCRSLEKLRKHLEPRGKKLEVWAAHGAGRESFVSACSNCTFELKDPGYLDQCSWDEFLTQMDVLFIRGEDSFARASLAGIPFVWNIYPQEGQYHLVKLQALHERMEPFFSHAESNNGGSRLPARFSLLYNYSVKEELCPEAQESAVPFGKLPSDQNALNLELEELCTDFLLSAEELRPCFEEFSRYVRSLGNLTDHLIEFISRL